MATASRTLFSRAIQTAARQALPKPALRRNLTSLPTRSTAQQPLRKTAQSTARFNSTKATPPPPPSAAPKKGGNGALLAFLALAVAGGAGYAYQTGALDAYLGVDPEEAKKQKSGKGWIPSQKDYQDVYNDIAAILEEDPDYDDGSYAPVLVRLGWHASGTYDKETKTGGSNGATMRFEPEGGHGANAGLVVARDLMEKIKQKHPWITYSDLWTLAAVCAIQEIGGPVIPWRPGRTDKDVSACTPDGRLPDASKEQKHIRDIFYRMGFDDREIVALLGAHAIGRCHPDRSGFEGPWTFSPTYFTNAFYKLLLEEKWVYKKWKGPTQFIDKKTGGLMMLPSDMALVKDKEFRKHVERFAADEKVFFDEFSASFAKLLELGVPFEKDEKWNFKRTTD